jgi:hypothetical protein
MKVSRSLYLGHEVRREEREFWGFWGGAVVKFFWSGWRSEVLEKDIPQGLKSPRSFLTLDAKAKALAYLETTVSDRLGFGSTNH